MSDLLTLFVIVLGGCLFYRRRALRYLRFLQQEEYDNKRFFRWWWTSRAFDRKGSYVAAIACALDAWTGAHLIIACLAAVALWVVVFYEEDPRTQGKVRLKMTERATRIYRLSCVLYTVMFLMVSWCIQSLPHAWIWVSQIVHFQLSPMFLMAATYLLQRSEDRRQKGYVAEAKAILEKVSPYVIGITGSYGKTSAKDALGHILQATLGPTFWPAKGINTVMGNTREIRACLKPGIRYAIMEMGAYGIGSIRRLCELTPPHAAIITAIGTAHLERFRSTDTILKAKSELAQALPSDGILVCNGDDAGARRIAQEYPTKTTLLYGFDNEDGRLDCWVSQWAVTPKGTEFTLHWKGKSYSAFTPLLGKPALSNVLGAFSMACALGANPEYALGVIHGLEPVDNRLQLQKEGPITFLRDAYNSNPVGFAAALDVMKALPADRRLLMTPGIIELGPQQYEQNEKMGQLAAQVCDVAIVVGTTNRSALVSGLEKGGLVPSQLFVCDTRDSAFKQLDALKHPGDIILIENDLPDVYEAKASF